MVTVVFAAIGVVVVAAVVVAVAYFHVYTIQSAAVEAELPSCQI